MGPASGPAARWDTSFILDSRARPFDTPDNTPRILRGSRRQRREAPILPDYLRIPVGPGALHVDRYGHGGRPIVLLHGFPTCAFLWRDVGVRLARLRHVAYAFDLFGYGESDRPFDADFGIAAQAEYLDTALTALRVARATVVGVDLGGTVALRLAATRPDRVERLVLVNTPTDREVPGKDVDQLERRTVRFALRATRSVTGAAPLLQPILERSVADPDTHMPARLVARYVAPFVGVEGVAHLYALARALRRVEVEEIPLEELAVPTVVVRSQFDEWLDDTVAERLVATIPGARLLRVPGAGRLLPEERPDLVAQLAHAVAMDLPLPDPGGRAHASAGERNLDRTGAV